MICKMCAAESANSTFVRRSSFGDWLVVDKRASHLIQAGPVSYAKSLFNRLFARKNILVSMGSNESQLALAANNGAAWTAVDHSHPAPLPVIAAKTLAMTQVNEKFPLDYKTYNLRAYRYFNDSELYLRIEINPAKSPPMCAYVFLCRPSWKWNVKKIDNYDFKSDNHHFSMNHTMLTVHPLRWTTVTPAQPAPADVEAAAFIARETVEAQHHGELPRCDLMAYKKVPKENDCATDFFFKMNIAASGTNSKCLFVKLTADHHGGAGNVDTTYRDFSPTVL